jgi:hypothetical protein
LPPKGAFGFKLLAAFEALFQGNVYRHRQSTLGNSVATHLYEDLYDHGGSQRFNERVVAGQCVVNVEGSTRGVKARRGDGTFGTIVPGIQPLRTDGFVVLQGMVALTHIGAEFKIVATAHLKQIDRVLNDLTGSATSLKEKSANAITVGFAAVNYSERWTGLEGTRSFPVERKPPRALQESEETSRRLLEIARPAFDEFLLLKFRATNQEPFPFAWLNPSGMAADYGAALVRIANLYDNRFTTVPYTPAQEAPPRAAERLRVFGEDSD